MEDTKTLLEKTFDLFVDGLNGPPPPAILNILRHCYYTGAAAMFDIAIAEITDEQGQAIVEELQPFLALCNET